VRLAVHCGAEPPARQVAGAGFAIAPETLRSLADGFGPLRSILIRHEQVLLAPPQQSACCNASHTVEARMCRWLLRLRDLTGSDETPLTQEYLAQMLGFAAPQYQDVNFSCFVSGSRQAPVDVGPKWSMHLNAVGCSRNSRARKIGGSPGTPELSSSPSRSL
jgi:hypothetical protein